MAVAMPVTMSVENCDRTAEATMDGATVQPIIRSGHGFEPGATIRLPWKAGGDCTNSGSPHHRQHHTARTLHGSHPEKSEFDFLMILSLCQRSAPYQQRKRGDFAAASERFRARWSQVRVRKRRRAAKERFQAK